jgi:hypothetical protein
MTKLIIIAINILLVSNFAFSQSSGPFTFAGGPSIGYYVNSVTDLNSELIKVGFPQISKNGFLTLGGSGYIELPAIKHLRIGGYGFGFSESQTSAPVSGITTNQFSVKYSFSGAGITIEYDKMLGEKFDFTIGGAIGIGSLNIDLFKHPPAFRYINGSIWSDSTNYKNEMRYSSQSYTFEPRIGISYQLNNYMDFKLNAGYSFAFQNKWKLDDVYEVDNIPSGIKAQGFNINLTMNIGLFFN